MLSNEELCQLIRSRLSVTNDLRSAVNQILDYCLARGSRDNMTVVMAIFEAAPKTQPELAAAEAKWLEEVKQKAFGTWRHPHNILYIYLASEETPPTRS